MRAVFVQNSRAKWYLLGGWKPGAEKKPSVDAATDLITLNRKVQVGRLPEHQAFRTWTNMHNSI